VYIYIKTYRFGCTIDAIASAVQLAI
jgi:hypothetical protein